MILRAGFFGIGLAGFEKASCMKQYPHNIFLQTAVVVVLYRRHCFSSRSS